MVSDKTNLSEAERLRALQATCLLDTPPEAAFDELAQLAAAICNTPMALVSLVAEHRQWFKARVGLECSETSREVSFCAHALHQDSLLLVPDATLDSRFAHNPLVLGHPHLRFYAGYPLSTSTGARIGTLCVLDRVPRELTPIQQQALRVLARQVMTQIELKTQLLTLQTAMQEKEKIAAALRLSDHRLRSFIDQSPTGAYLVNADQRIIYCNRTLTDPYQKAPEDWIGHRIDEVWAPEDANRASERNRIVLERNCMVRFEEKRIVPDGRSITWNIYKFPLLDNAGERLLATIAVDVTREKLAERQLGRSQQRLRDLNLKLHRLSLTDGLTRVKNRRGLEAALQQEFERSRRSQSPLSMLMLDIDSFKQFNDAFGHVAGDEVLQRVAALMKEHARKSDLVARYGGEEFIALLPDTEEAEAHSFAQRLRHFIAIDAWKHRLITVSVGVGSLPAHISSASEYIHYVDEALYAAKHAGRNQVCLASQSSSPLEDHSHTQESRPVRRPSLELNILSEQLPH